MYEFAGYEFTGLCREAAGGRFRQGNRFVKLLVDINDVAHAVDIPALLRGSVRRVQYGWP